MKIRNKRPRSTKRANKAYRRRRMRRIENNVYDVKRDGMIGTACRRGYGGGVALK